jgi:hypothetical protein
MDSLHNGDSLVMLWLVTWSTYSPHRIVVTPALAFGKRNELLKRFCHAEVPVRQQPVRMADELRISSNPNTGLDAGEVADLSKGVIHISGFGRHIRGR